MKLSKIPDALRQLADKFERAGFSGDYSVDVSMNAFGLESRDELKKWARFMGTPGVDKHNSALTAYYGIPGVDARVVAYFERGLLGGKIVQVEQDCEAGLSQLLSEVEQSEPVPSESQNLRAISAEQPQWSDA